MRQIDTFEGVKATVQNIKFQFLAAILLVSLAAIFTGCGNSTVAGNDNGATPVSSVDPNEAAATVNGTAIKLEEVERGLKQQAQGQESKLSPLELAQARLQILDQLIQQEVMYQKAVKENTVPSDDEVTAEFNKTKTQSNLSQEQFDKMMKDNGQTEASARESIKRGLAVQKLIDKITGKIEPPKDSEIDAFYAGNKSAFVKKKGVKLAAIVIDPANSGEGDTTTDEQSAVLKGNEVIKRLNNGEDFAKVASEVSEDQSKLQGGDLGYLSEDDLKQNFSPQVAAAFMNPNMAIGKILPVPMQGKYYILKLQERSDKDEDLTLESPGVRQKVIDQLISARKQLLAASYQALAMNDAKIVNNLAQKVVDNPNELSGARPAGSGDAANTNSANTNSAAGNSNANAANTNKSAVNMSNKPIVNAANTAASKPAGNVVNTPAKPAPAANTNK